MTFSEYPDPEYIKGFRNPMTQLRQERPKKKIGFVSKTTTLHMHQTFLYISLLLWHYTL